MKKIRFILTIILVSTLSISYSQMRGPSEPGGDPEVGGDPPLGAPVGSGTFVLMGLAIAYGAKRIYRFNELEDDE
jgi:hypothetical protein